MPRPRALHTNRRTNGAAPPPKIAKDSRPRGVKISDVAVARSRQRPAPRSAEMLSLQEQAQRMAINPFEFDPTKLHPPGVIPPQVAERLKAEGGPKIAMDDALSLSAPAIAWAGNLYTQAFAEGMTFLGYTYLSELSQRAEYRVVIEATSEEMTRKWIRLEAADDDTDEHGDDEFDGAEDRMPPVLEALQRKLQASRAGNGEEKPKVDNGGSTDKTKKIKELDDYLRHLQLQRAAKMFVAHDCTFGRAHVYVDVDGAYDKADELKMSIGDGYDATTKAKIRKGAKLELRNVEPVWCYPTAYNSNDPLAPNWYLPERWFAMAKETHKTRMLTGIGRPVPDLLKPAYSFGGLSLLQMGKPYVDNWLRTRQSVADLLHSFTVFALASDLATLVQEDGLELFRRIDLFNNIRDNRGLMLLNKEVEELTNLSVPLGTLDALQAQTQEHMAAVWRTPLVKLLGIQPSGLNADSEGVMRAYNDTIHGGQEWLLRPLIHPIIGMAQMALWGEIDPAINFIFEPLKELNEKEEAEVRKIEAETDTIQIDNGTIDPAEARQRLAKDPGSPYHGIDPNDVPEPPEPEQPPGFGGGGEGEGAGPPAPGGSKPPIAGTERGAGAQDGVIPFGATDAEWSETDHPRGQPGNAGQFGSGGGGGEITGPTDREKITHAAAMYGAGSKQHKEAQRRFGAGSKEESRAEGRAYGESLASQASGGHVAAKGAPLQSKGLKRVGAQMGSNPGGVFADKAGDKFYVKQGKSPAHVTNELTAASLYQLAGAPTLKYRPVEGGNFVATEMAPLDKKRVQDFSPGELKAARDDFVTHAWLANWDAVGLDGDNLGTVGGKPTALDVGGALEFRAMGAPKGAAFGDAVGELDTLRSAKTNPIAAKVFGNISQAELRSSAEKVLRIPDKSIRETVKANGGSDKLGETLVKRKRDIAKRLGLQAHDGRWDEEDEEAIAAALEAPAMDAFTEADHPHAPAGSSKGGQFVSTGGGGGGGTKEAETPTFKTKKEHAGHLLSKGTTAAALMSALGWPSISVPATAKSLGMKLEKKGNIYTGTPMTSEELAASKKADAEKKAAAKAAAPKPEPGAAPAAPSPDPDDELTTVSLNVPKKATPDELKKAAKNTVVPTPPGFSPEATKLVDAFNKQYGPGTPSLANSPDALEMKVADWHKLQAATLAANTKHNAAAAAQQKAQQEKAAKAKAEAEAAAKAEHTKIMRELGIDDADAKAYEGLVEMMGSSPASALASFKMLEAEAKGLNLPISGFEYAMLRSYTGSGYQQINGALRLGSISEQQHLYTKVVNKALAKMPAFTGETKRSANLNSTAQALYVAGHVVEERAFTSTSKNPNWQWGGNTSYVIKGKSGRDVSKVSSHESEGEVLYPARTFFRVDKVEGEPGAGMTVHMSEVD